MADGKIIIETDLDSSGIKKGLSDLEKSSKSGTDSIKNGFDDIGKSTKGAGSQLSELGQTAMNGLKAVGGAIAGAFAVEKIIEFGKAAIEAAGSAKAISSQFTQVFGDLEPAAQQAVEKMADKFGMVPNRLKPSMSQMTSMFKGLGLDTETAMSKATDAVTASADAAAFYDVSYQDANSALTSFIKGNYEGGEAIGLFANDTQMAQYAIQKGLVGTTAEWSSLDEATKQATRLEYAQNMQNLAGATGQAARESDGLENQLGNVNQAWTDFLAIVGGPVLGLAVDALKGLTSGLQLAGEGFKTLVSNAQNMDFSGVAAELEPFGVEFERVKMVAVGAFEEAKTKVMEVMPQIIEAVQPILGAFQNLWENLKPVFLYLVQVLYESVIPALSALFNAFMESLPGIISFVAPIYEVLTNVISFVGNVIGMIIALLQGDWSTAWQFAGTAVQNVVDSIGSILNFLWSIITGILTSIGNSIATAWQGIYDNTIGKVTETAQVVATKWQETQTDSQAKWAAIQSDLVTKWNEIYSDVSQKVQNTFQSVADKWSATKTDTQEKWSAIKSDLATKWGEIYTNVSTKVQETFQSVADKWQASKDDAQTKWGAIRDDLTTKAGEIFTNVTNKAQEIVTTLPDKWESIRSGAAELWGGENGIVKTITNIADDLPDAIYQIAYDMLTKIGEGITANLKAATDAVGGLVKTLKETFTTALGIHSPSTVFEEYGYNIVQGLINGLDADSVMKFVNNMVEQIKSAFANGNFNMQAAIEFLGSGALDFFKSIGVGGASMGDLTAPVSGGVTSGFGWRDPFMTDSGEMSSDYHAGIDIGAPYGAPVGAAGAGTVTQAGWNGGYGNSVTIDHGNGLETFYAHLSEILVNVGDLVTKLQTIGLVGSTGNSTGPHLHFGLKQNGEWIDPSALFGLATGTNRVPKTGPYLLHKDEAVVPKKYNPALNGNDDLVNKLLAAVAAESVKFGNSLSASASLSALNNVSGSTTTSTTTDNSQTVYINQPIATLADAYREMKIQRKEAVFG
ncbi:peptidoglycan DD-metalloendopeptidase family protein [Acetobacterium wieringae]|uniref:peptidoglycan DD-metalloendopeptidase family protein n=1 Tax=Acetobacterium wieringae TaxID=52694 RepID=UPI002033C0E5|nr:peptidoglycan DD-metalloendopeptidase family protein [Acetobacterium wieringae]URN85147.1 peptidoglycan DD-metalloendopeptidase family protein [Acetobacterium wieringae]